MRGLFSGVFDEICIEVPSFHKSPPSFSLKNFWLYLGIIIIIFFLQNAPS